MNSQDNCQLAETNSLLEQAIATREQEFRSLAESSPDSIIRYDRDGRIRYLNPGLLGFLGLSAADIIGRLPGEVWPDGRYAEIERAIARAMETGEATIAEFCEADATGEPHSHQIHVVPERDATGQIVGTIAFGREVTAIREAERQLSHFIANLPGMAYTYRLSPDGQGCFPCTSPAIEEFYGLKPEDVKGDMTPLHMLAHPDDRPRIEAAIAESARTMMPFRVEIRVCRPGLPERWLDVRSIPELEADGSIIWYGIMLDITERKATEEAQLESETRFRSIFEFATDCMLILDMNGRIVDINRTGHERLGYAKQEMLGRKIAEFDTPEYAPLVSARLAKFGKEGNAIFESAHVRKDGTVMPVEINTRMLLLDGETRYISVIRDITEHKRAERARQARARSLECMERINQTIQGTTDLEQMMGDVLDVVLGFFGCDRAFLLHPCDPDAVEWQVPMERTRPEYPGVLALGMVMPMAEEVARTMRTLLDADGAVKFGPGAEHPLPGNVSKQFGMKSIMMTALHPKLDKPWQFGIHQCSHAKVWTEDEAELFQRIGQRLSDALTSLLMQRNLRASEEKFRSLAENMPDILIHYDREGRRTYVNPALIRNYAVRAEQMIGLTQQEANPFNMPETYRLALEHALASGERSEFELQIPTLSGEMRTNLIFIAAERATDGQITGAICIGHDITERKQAEQQLRELSAHLQTVREEEKAHLAREIHDELGGMLVALQIETHLLNSGLSADQKRMPLFSRVESMVDLLDDALKATRRIITDLRPPVLDDHGLMAAFEWQAAQFHKHTAIDCRVACLFREGNRCIVCKDCEYTLDKTRSITLFRIFQESLNNVAKHSGASRVEVELQPCEHEVVLSISDNGRGLPEGHTIASTSYGIRGMRERVEQLGGNIEFDKPPGGGFRLVVRLPQPARNKNEKRVNCGLASQQRF